MIKIPKNGELHSLFLIKMPITSIYSTISLEGKKLENVQVLIFSTMPLILKTSIA